MLLGSTSGSLHVFYFMLTMLCIYIYFLHLNNEKYEN
jgi:hypothetical protein